MALIPLSSLTYQDFQKKTDYEKYVYFDTALNEAKKYKTAYLTQKDITKSLFSEVAKRDKEIDNLTRKNFTPKWGLSFSITGNLDNNLNGTLNIYNSYHIYFFKCFFVYPSIGFNFGKNIYSNTALFGGSIGFGFGVIFE